MRLRPNLIYPALPPSHAGAAEKSEERASRALIVVPVHDVVVVGVVVAAVPGVSQTSAGHVKCARVDVGVVAAVPGVSQR